MICEASPRILDEFGRPFAAEPAPQSPPAQPLELREMWISQRGAGFRAQRGERQARASYDAARDSDETRRHWQNADALDGDSANAKSVRHALVSRSRYEAGSNGYYKGIERTHVNMLVGVGPSLRMQTRNRAFNEQVEREWYEYCQAIDFRRKLWAMGLARLGDGEAIAMLITNPAIPGPVQLDIRLIETEQCQTPYLPFAEKGYIDGIRFDNNNNVLWYDILPQHPGSGWAMFNNDPLQVPPEQVLHWFKLERPGTHRGVPDMTSTLNVGANSRRFRETTLAAAETAADPAALLHTNSTAAEIDRTTPMSTVEFEKRMLMALPRGYAVTQMKAEHPNAQYGEFHRQQISEQARPISMPYNAAACDSSTYSFASGKLDTLCYRAEIDVERLDAEELVVERLFVAWFRERYYVARSVKVPRHQWDWPAHPVIDRVSEEHADDKALKNGKTSLRRVYAKLGLDFEDELTAMTEDYFGDSKESNRDTMREILLLTNYPKAAIVLARLRGDAQADPENQPEAVA